MGHVQVTQVGEGMGTPYAAAEAPDAPDAPEALEATPAAAPPRSSATAWIEALPMRVLGAVLLVGALDPARWPDYLCPQWFFGVLAAGFGAWAGAPLVDRPVLVTHRWRHRASRHRNTLLAGLATFLAAFQSPPVWLMAVEVLLLLAFLTLVDASSPAARPPLGRFAHACYAAAASALVLLAAVAPITGGWWGRLVAAAAVLGTLGLLYATLRLRRPAGVPRDRLLAPRGKRHLR